MSWRHLLALALLAAAALVSIAAFRPESADAPGGQGVYVPVGYAREVDRLIAEGKLVYDCAADRIEPRGLSSTETYFLEHSYLDDDLAAWRANDRRPFVVSREELPGGRCRGELLRVNASYHNQRLPTYRASSWTGRLYLGQTAVATSLSSGERTLEITRPPLDHLPLEGRDYQDVWFGSDRSEDARSPRLALKMLEAGRAFAQLTPVGDATRLEVIGARPSLRLDGCPLGQGDLVRLDSGDALRLRLEDDDGGVRLDERFQVETGGEAGLLSFVTTVNGEVRRRTYSGRLGMADEIAAALDTAAIRGGGRDDFDVHLTLDAFLDHTLNRLLGDYAERRYGRRPLRAAVTVLEAETGRALALASYPAAADLPSLRLRRSGDASALTLNHNFDHHPVGSAAKPLLAAAALATRPELASLEVPCFGGGSPPELLGFPLGPARVPGDCRGAGEDGRIDLPEFLRVSSNRYMLYLGMLALAEWRDGFPLPDPDGGLLPAADRYLVAGQLGERRPWLPVVKQAAGERTELADVADRRYFQRFASLFGVGFHYRRESAGEQVDLAPWRPALEAAAGGAAAVDEDTALAFSPVAPQEVNLRTNLIQQLRQDLYTTLLGIGNHRWSNLQLAAAFARLTTGRTDLAPRLVERVTVPAPDGDGDGEEEVEVLWSLDEALGPPPGEGAPGTVVAGLAENHRRLVLAGMRQVVDHPAGTAAPLSRPLAAIAAAAPPGVEYRLLAKTGTPSDLVRALERGATVHDPAAVVRTPYGAFVESGVLALVVERAEAGETSRLVLTLWVEGQGGSRQVVDLAAAILQPLVEARWPEDWLERRPRAVTPAAGAPP